MSSTKYCSLDIETTGFDPAKDEILEIGLVFFDINQKTIIINTEYTQVFKPKSEVSETILALTGITRAELDRADDFIDHRAEISEKLKDVVLVGHNIGFDIKFLQGLGLKLEGPSIDTLDLAQVFLPTHPSYNLENLMHYFGVPHTEAHRALADARATLEVLQGLLGIFNGFPESLKREIKQLVELHNLPWRKFLDCSGKSKALRVCAQAPQKADAPESIQLQHGRMYNFPLGFDVLKSAAADLKRRRTKSLLVVPRRQEVMELWRAGFAQALFSGRELFNEHKFELLKSKKILQTDELKFVLKILVWRRTNWQQKVLGDLNLSFFGGQFKNLVFGTTESPDTTAPHLVCDYPNFLQLAGTQLLKDRRTVFVGLRELEKALSENIAEKVSWGYANYLFKNLFDPDTGAGNERFKKIAEEGLIANDMFFGLTSALFQSDPPGFSQLTLNALMQDAAKFNKLKAAAEHYSAKLRNFASEVNSHELTELAESLMRFFTIQPNRVKWLELSKTSCAFFSSPVEIAQLAHQYFDLAKETILCDALPSERVIEYFIHRLGLRSFVIEHLKPMIGQNVLPFKTFKPKVEVFREDLNWEKLLEVLRSPNLPAAVVFGSPAEARGFYETYHKQLKAHAFVLMQMGSSGGRAIRNFGIHRNSLLITSDKLMLKSLDSPISVERPIVKILVLGRLPFEQYKHPLWEEVAKQFTDPFSGFAVPRALLNIHLILRFFYSDQLQTFQIWDSKLKKDFAKPFLDYFNSIE